MFAKLATLVLAVSTIAAAAPWGAQVDQCNVGSLSCCTSNQSTSSDNKALSGFLSIVSAAVQSVTVPVGVTCTPVTVIGAGSASTCAAQPVCCSNNFFNGVVAAGCLPANVQA